MMTVLETKSVSNEIHHQYLGYFRRLEGFCRENAIKWPLARTDADAVVSCS